jgi:hypothetical protein
MNCKKTIHVCKITTTLSNYDPETEKKRTTTLKRGIQKIGNCSKKNWSWIGVVKKSPDGWGWHFAAKMSRLPECNSWKI